MSTLAESRPENNLFEYTSGRWVYNESLRMKERTTVFNVEELRRLAAESVGQTAADVVSFTKYAEGRSNRVFLVVLRDGRQVVARVAYPSLVPKYLAISSEVATIEYMQRHGIPAPEIYAYSPDADNAAGVPYIMMEFLQGPTLEHVWHSLPDDEVISVVRQITELEARMMSLEFPACGSLYFTRDLEEVAPGVGVPLTDSTFCIGPDTVEAMWKGRRAELDVFRGPHLSVESVLSAAAHKEITYLEHFGQPVLPLRREKRRVYGFQKQSPEFHVELLQQYLAIAPSLVPKDPALRRFCIRHPVLQLADIVVARSPESGYKIVSLLDWQHASILPMFLFAGCPPSLQSFGEQFSHFMVPPVLPEAISFFTPIVRQHTEESHRARLAHYQYVMSMRESNRPHYDACLDALHEIRMRLFHTASAAWEGESYALKVALIQVVQRWEKFGGWDVPCPVEFDNADLRSTAKTVMQLEGAESDFERIQQACGIGASGWVHNESYTAVMAALKGIKKREVTQLRSLPIKEREDFLAHWPWSDMDEDVYM